MPSHVVNMHLKTKFLKKQEIQEHAVLDGKFPEFKTFYGYSVSCKKKPENGHEGGIVNYYLMCFNKSNTCKILNMECNLTLCIRGNWLFLPLLFRLNPVGFSLLNMFCFGLTKCWYRKYMMKTIDFLWTSVEVIVFPMR